MSPIAQLVKNLPAVQETWVQPLGWEDPLEKGKAAHSVFWPGEFHGLASPWGRKESDTTKQLSQKTRKDGVSRISVLRQKGGWWLEDRVFVRRLCREERFEYVSRHHQRDKAAGERGEPLQRGAQKTPRAAPGQTWGPALSGHALGGGQGWGVVASVSP